VIVERLGELTIPIVALADLASMTLQLRSA